MDDLIRLIEIAIAAEAEAHALATKELNPFSEATFREIGDGRLVYCGTQSPVHGAYGLGLDGALEERDWKMIERFFQELERPPAFWFCPLTDPDVVEDAKRFAPNSQLLPVHGSTLEGENPFGQAVGTSEPDHGEWTLAFSRREKPGTQERSLLALTTLHQGNTRFYLGRESATYTFFHRGLALVPFPAPSLSALQWKEAKEFGAKAIVHLQPSSLPLIYERSHYEP